MEPDRNADSPSARGLRLKKERTQVVTDNPTLPSERDGGGRSTRRGKAGKSYGRKKNLRQRQGRQHHQHHRETKSGTHGRLGQAARKVRHRAVMPGTVRIRTNLLVHRRRRRQRTEAEQQHNQQRHRGNSAGGGSVSVESGCAHQFAGLAEVGLGFESLIRLFLDRAIPRALNVSSRDNCAELVCVCSNFRGHGKSAVYFKTRAQFPLQD